MPASPNAYFRPTSLSEALALLAQPNRVALAGGTSLLASEEGLAAAAVDLQDAGLDQIKPAGQNTLAVGAMVRLHDLGEHLGAVPGDSPAALLREAIHRAGPNTYRHMATAGGTVATRLPDSEWLAALLVLDASLALEGPAAIMSVADYLAAPERPTGLITALSLPLPAGKGASDRVARTPADYPIVSVTGWRSAAGEVRLAATGVAPLPVRLYAAEAAGSRLDEASIEAAAREAAAVATHPGDFRGSAAYRAEMAGVLARRVLNALK